MSLAHLLITKKDESSIKVRYLVESPDFNDNREWQEIGEVIIQKNEKTYEFTCLGPWIGEKVIPPHLHNLPDEQIRKLDEYKGYGYGAWSYRIGRWIERAIDNDSYPDTI